MLTYEMDEEKEALSSEVGKKDRKNLIMEINNKCE
jgi:hypothetical protein